MVDVCIIGGGVIGAAIARELSRYALSITLLEQKNDLAEGSTKANSAIVHAGFDAAPGTLKARFNRLGQSVFSRWCEELKVPYRRNTSLVVAFKPEDRSGLVSLMDRGQQNQINQLRIIDARELRQREPQIGPQACCALLAESGGITSPYELALELAAHAYQNGVKFQLQTTVLTVRRESNYFVCETSGGPVLSRCIVNAAGINADLINNQLSESTFQIRPRRGEYLMLDKVCGSAFQATIFQLPTAMGKGILISPTVENTVLLGPTAENIEDRDDVRTTAGGFEQILRVASMSWPDIPRQHFITAFAGLRATSDRDDFIVGPSDDIPGLFNAAGIDSPGLTAAPAIAMELAANIADYCQSKLKNDFRPPEHKKKPFRLMSDSEKEAAIEQDSSYGRIVCRCEQVTEAEVVEAIRRPIGARTVDGVKRRTRAGMGRCQAGFCLPRVMEILSREVNIPMTAVEKSNPNTELITGRWPEAINPLIHEDRERQVL